MSTLDVIASVLHGYGITTASPDSAKADMLSTGCFLVLISPEYLVQK